MTNETTPIVTIKNNAVVANSRDVAAYFGKHHHHVLRDIDALIEQAPAIASNFGSIEIDVKVGFGTRKDRAFDMTRDGFTLLAMGFTGKKALQFKLRYIEQFNAMEEELKARPVVTTPVIPTNFVEALRLAADEAEKRMLAEQALIEAQPKIDLAERVETHLRTLARVVRTFDGVNSQRTKMDLKAAGYLYKDAFGAYRVYSKYRQQHFIEKIEPTYGKVDIFVGPKGYEVLDQLYREGRLTMLKGWS